ncbi:MAG: bifunctional phosphoribosylaminoimidazolecarboxamide formyltransferase/IMP cyclohydrolase, partial [Balneolaceae bacterium]
RDLPKQLSISLPRSGDLRYGENPHQMASVYGHQSNFIDCFHGKELSYNNYIDIDAALQLMSDFRDSGPAAAIFKHTVPCGVAQGDTVADAYKRAFATDTNSPFGGIIIASKEIDLDAARAMDAIFTEIILAPSFHPDAEDLLTEKKNRRLVRILQFPEAGTDLNVRSIFGGMVAQQPNRLTINPDTLQVVTERKPTDTEMNDLLFGWTVVKHVKSNAIVYAKGGQTLGIGTGQTSRVGSSELAVANAQKEGLSLSESIIASDAFFPFADGVEAAAEAGATAVIQPGGSVRDQDVIDAANRLGLAMVFTGIRHFRH